MTLFISILATAALCVWARPAAAQNSGNVDIDFEVGDFDSARGDWPITAVNVSGDLASGRAFTVELRDGDGLLLWSGTAVYTPPRTVVDVDRFVAVGDVEEAGIAQRQPGASTTTTTEPGTTTTTDRPTSTTTPTTSPTTPTTAAPGPGGPAGPGSPGSPNAPQVLDDVTVIGGSVDTDGDGVPDVEEGPAGSGEPEVEGDVTTPDEQLPQRGSGVGGAGQLALSMVIAVIFVAILFRAPLPSATTTRWRK